jgi:hypothetical protein
MGFNNPLSNDSIEFDSFSDLNPPSIPKARASQYTRATKKILN